MGSGTTGTLGDKAEQQALRFLIRRGLTLVTRNFRSRSGEIDLIMLHGDCLTFVEVRYRSSTHYSSPAPTVDRHKQRRLIRTAAMFISSEQRYARRTIRFDVVAIAGGMDGAIDWIQDAFRPDNSTL